jgi:hypothetical protein
VRRSCSFSILLPQPAHAGVEDEEHGKRNGDHDERVRRLVDHDFVDHDLSEKRRC